jgi:broad specificity phosphatase PhoE
MRYLEIRRHAMRVKGSPHLVQAGVDLARQVGTRMGPFERVITSPAPRALETALAMGFAVDEQMEQFASMPDGVDEEVEWPADFATWGAAIRTGGAAARFGKRLADLYCAIAEMLPDGGAALIVHHGGIVEAGAVACLPDADHAAWGPYCRCCEGVRLAYDNGDFVEARVLRVPLAPEG